MVSSSNVMVFEFGHSFQIGMCTEPYICFDFIAGTATTGKYVGRVWYQQSYPA